MTTLFTRVRKWAARLLMAAGCLLLLVMFTPLVPWWARQLAGPWNDPQGDMLIVLGGSAVDSGFLGDSSYWRSVYAARVYRQSPYREVIVSGGGAWHVAQLMRDFVVCEGIPAGIVQVEDQSGSTRENALFVKKLLGNTPGRKVLLTSDYHMFRARRAFQKAGLNVLPHPFPDVVKRSSSRAERWPLFFDLCTEMVKCGYYYARGWI
ncbi:MAG TPA: YdcF family protein [Bryobacteraceae bacterium]|nr:YdcF family protein [Bryobacteraceae bacterium]